MKNRQLGSIWNSTADNCTNCSNFASEDQLQCGELASFCGSGIIGNINIRQCEICQGGSQASVDHLYCLESASFCGNRSFGHITTRQCYICPRGYQVTWDHLQCQECNKQCLTCDYIPGNCTSCNESLVLQSNSCLTNCPEGYYNTSICFKCNNSCETCENETNFCTSCNASQWLQNNICLTKCPDGFYKGNASICIPCNTSCLTCENAANFCTSCNASQALFNNTCLTNCPDGQFGNQSICSECNQTSCPTCTKGQNSCTSCKSNYFLCKEQCLSYCGSHQYFDANLCICKDCEDMNCQICTNANLCTKCNAGFSINWYNSSTNDCGQEFCLSNEQILNKLCYQCPSLCKTCISDKICISCPIDFGLRKYSDGRKLCEPCEKWQIWKNNLCTPNCTEGQYLNMNNVVCENCKPPCKACLNETACTSCLDTHYLTERKECISNCPDGYLISNQSGALYCLQCPINHCQKCESILECKQCNNSWQNYNGACISQCPSAMPANTLGTCSSKIENQETIDKIKSDFTNSMLSIFAMDSEQNSLSGNKMELSQQVSFDLIESFMNLTETLPTDTLDSVWTNQMIANIITASVGNKVSNLTNASIDDLSDNKNEIVSLCEATKMSQLSNYSTACKDIVTNVKNAKMTLQQTQNILGLLAITSKPRQVKNSTKNETEIQSIYSSFDREQLREALNSTSNSLCMRSSNNSTESQFSIEVMDIIFKNVSNQISNIDHPSSTVEVTFLESITNQKGTIQNSIETDASLEIVPKSNETFLSKVVQGKILKFCSPSLTNVQQPAIQVGPNELKVIINFTIQNSTQIAKFSDISHYYCAFAEANKSKLIEEKQNNWQIYGKAEILKQNENKSIALCRNQNALGYYAVIYDISYSSAEGSSSLILIVCVCVGTVILGIIGFTLYWFFWRRPQTNSIIPASLDKKASVNKNIDVKTQSKNEKKGHKPSNQIKTSEKLKKTIVKKRTKAK